MDSLFRHVGKVTGWDTYNQAVQKVKEGITAQTNQSMACYKLMRETPQAGKLFADWWPKIVEQSEPCQWQQYDTKKVAGNAILQQCDNKKLQRKIIAEDLTFYDIIKHGLAYEQSEKKLTRINKDTLAGDKMDRVAQLEEEVRALKAGNSSASTRQGKSATVKCKTYIRGKHGQNKYPATEMDCYAC